VCASGYSSAVGYQCTRCKTGTQAAIYSVLVMVLALIIMAICFLLVELLGLGDGADAVSTTSSSLHGLGVMKKFAALPWSKLRIPIVAFQIVTQYITITGVPLPEIYRNFLAWIDVLNLNLGWVISLGCLTTVNFYEQLLITTLSPFVATAILVCTYTIVRYKNKVVAVTGYSSQRAMRPARTSKLEQALAKHYLVFLVMTFLIYSTVSTTVFQTFACDSIDDDSSIKLRYLRADYSVQCGTFKH
jgi:hypothetical protein